MTLRYTFITLITLMLSTSLMAGDTDVIDHTGTTKLVTIPGNCIINSSTNEVEINAPNPRVCGPGSVWAPGTKVRAKVKYEDLATGKTQRGDISGRTPLSICHGKCCSTSNLKPVTLPGKSNIRLIDCFISEVKLP